MAKGATAAFLQTALSALLLGVLVWYISRNEITRVEEAAALIEVVNAGDVEVKGENGQPPQVAVELTGPMIPLERALSDLQQQELTGQVRLTEAQRTTGGRVTIPVSQANFAPVRDPRVRLRVLDREVVLMLTPMATRTLPVRLDTNVDRTRFRATLVPSEVTVRGPKAVLDRVDAVTTETLNAKEALEIGLPGIQRTVRIAPVQDGEPIECDEPVIVTLLFEEEMVERTIPNVPVRLLTTFDFPYQVRISQQEHRTTSITVRGPKSVVEADPHIADHIEVYLEVDDPRLIRPRPAPYLIERRYRLPDRVTFVRMSLPEKVEVDVSEPVASTPTPPPP